MFLLLFLFCSLASATPSRGQQTTSAPSSDDMKAFIAECGGDRALKSTFHGTYLVPGTDEPIMIAGPANEWFYWTVTEQNGKAVFKTYREPARYLRGYHNDTADFVDYSRTFEEWTPIRNQDGSWSLKSIFGGFLSAWSEGKVTTIKQNYRWEHFACEVATEIAPTPVENDKVTPESPVTSTQTSQTPGPYTQFFAECEKLDTFKSVAFGTYLSSFKDGVIRMISEPTNDARWIIGRRERRAVFKTARKPTSYLRGWYNNTVDLAPHLFDYEMWMPVRSAVKGEWAFKNVHGGFLSAHKDGTVGTLLAVEKGRGKAEHFRCIDSKSEIAKIEAAKKATSTRKPKVVSVTPTTPTPTPEVDYGLDELTSGGYRYIKACDYHGQNRLYLRSWWGPDSKSVNPIVDLAPHRKEDERWFIESYGGPSVLLRSYNGRTLYSHHNGSVDAIDDTRHELWTPVKNADGTWSFQSARGGWLSGHRPEGTVVTMPHKKECEHFQIEDGSDDYTTPPTKTTTASTSTSTTTTATTTVVTTTSAKTTTPGAPLSADVRDLLAEVAGGYRYFKACDYHNKERLYLRAWKGGYNDKPWHVDLAPHSKEAERWYFEEHNGKLALKTIWTVPSEKKGTTKYLRAEKDGSVTVNHDTAEEQDLWTPVKNSDGTWSFLGAHGAYLSGHQPEGTVTTMPHNKECEQFKLEKKN